MVNHFVTKSNFDTIYPLFDHYLSNASFISIDSEFSGLASQRILRISNIQDRYHFLAKEIKSRSLLEFGVSIFTKIPQTSTSSPPSLPASTNNTESNNTNTRTQEKQENTDSDKNGIKRKFVEDDEDIGSIISQQESKEDEEDEIVVNIINATNIDDSHSSTKVIKVEETGSTTPSIRMNEYNVVIFTFLMLNTQDFTISPRSMSFLAQHGLDFNRLFLDGIPFTPFTSTSTVSSASSSTASAPKAKPSNSKKKPVSNNINTSTTTNNNHENGSMTKQQFKIIDSLTKHNPTLVVHNGLFDLLFIYQSFIGDLPEQLHSFIAKFLVKFPKIYDTKYISEFKFGENRSYLEYLFSKYERMNYKRYNDNSSFVRCKKIDKSTNGDVEYINQLSFSFSKPYTGTPICENFSNHGFCRFGDSCLQSHDVNIILDQEECQQQQKQIKKMKHQHIPDKPQPDNDSQVEKVAEDELIHEIDQPSNNVGIVNHHSHCAGDDSAMTGFIFSYYLLFFKDDSVSDEDDQSNLKNKLSEIENRVYISGKQIPLLFKKSNYV